MLIFRCVGVLYLLSGIWCALQPELAAVFLGYKFSSTLGLAEFFSVYGGLQFGIAIAILASSFMPDYRIAASFFSFVTSLGLFAFRLLSVLFMDQSAVLIYMLGLEGVLVVVLLCVWRRQIAVGKDN